MKKQSGNLTDAENLHRKAEEILKKKKAETSLSFSEQDMLKLFHELQVHQIELEMQNEELIAAKAKIEELAAEKYKELYDFAPSGYITLSKDGEILELNFVAANLLGKERLKLIKNRFEFFVSTNSQKTFNYFLHNVFTENIKHSCEVQLAIDGDLSIFVHIEGIVDKSGSCCFFNLIDITERKLAEEAQKQSEQKLRRQNQIFDSLIKNLPLGVFMVDAPSGKPLVANEKALTLLGRGILPDATRHNLAEVYKAFKNDINHPYPVDEMPIIKGMRGESSSIDDMIVVRPDGCQSHLEVFGSPVKDDKGNIWASLVSFSDITERKLSEAIFRDIVEKNPMSIQILDMEGYPLQINSAHSKLFGVRPPSDYSILKDPQLLSQGFGELFEKMKKGEVVYFPDSYYNVHDVDPTFPNNPVWINAVGFTLNDYNGIPERIVIMHENITERKLAEQELIKAKERAEESDHLKSAFLANMSHEIRTPMNGILGFAELLKSPELSGHQQQKYIRIIEKSGARMLNIINDIIDISKIEAGAVKLNLSLTNINEQIEFIYTFFRPEVEGKGMIFSFRNSLPTKESIIYTDREKVYAIFSNLIKNAIKYSKHGSIEFGYQKAGDFLEFYIKDTGIGIKKDRQEAIFERFIQADIKDRNATQGAGLGLAITKAYVEMLGGKIWVESEKDIGSTFYFTLPYTVKQKKMATKEDMSSDKAVNDLPSKAAGIKILIAEDDETSEMLIKIRVEKFGKEILKVRNGLDAVELLRNNPDIDLVLMDIQMPEMDGYEATRQIRQFNKNVVIIAQTAYGFSGDRERAIDAGCNDYISKPIKKEELLSLIQKYFKN